MSFIDSLINDTKSIIELSRENNQAAGLPEYLSKLESKSLEMRLKDLNKVKELNRSNSEELEVRMYPEGIPSGQIPVRTLTAVLGGLQTITDSVANTLFNHGSTRGPVPQDILGRNSWLLKTVRAGSFIAVLDLDHDHTLFPDELPQQKQITQELFNLFSASSEEESLLEVFSELGERTLSHYTEWTKTVKDTGIPFDLNWRTDGNEETLVNFNPVKAGEIYTILHEKISAHTEEICLCGTLTGLNVRLGTFEFVTQDSTKVNGKIERDVFNEAIKFLNKKCLVSLLKTTSTSTAGKEKVKYVLNDVSNLDNQLKIKTTEA
ncbi:hypothetical protein J2T12_005124 [Paenibacillus anaericanus]|uniref:hypothetical protein n=1 Tax=Paenibacillus anaericanus TaxID=170367 RepID=UPI002785BBD1|nr:hypothetical protein [Paenibacillus anaericanus]MDQ0091684.1 hypothetical protein [Paenibacillus anaericanus]